MTMIALPGSDAKYLSWKLWTKSDMTMIVLLGSKCCARLLMS